MRQLHKYLYVASVSEKQIMFRREVKLNLDNCTNIENDTFTLLWCVKRKLCRPYDTKSTAGGGGG